MANKRFIKPAKGSVEKAAVTIGSTVGRVVGSVESLATAIRGKANSSAAGSSRTKPASTRRAPRRGSKTVSGGRGR